MRGNFLALPTDCPQRDERLGWTGDIQVFTPDGELPLRLRRVPQLAGCEDLALEQARPGRRRPARRAVRAAASFGVGAVAAWGDAATVVPWVLLRALRRPRTCWTRQYASMRDWADVAAARPGDAGLWAGPDAARRLARPGGPAGQARQPPRTHGDIVATAYLFRSLRPRGAGGRRCSGEDADAATYAALAERRSGQAFLAEYVTPAGRMVSDAPDRLRPGARVRPQHRRRPSARRSATGSPSSSALGGYRIATGFVGTPLVADALTVTGHLDAAERLLTADRVPVLAVPRHDGRHHHLGALGLACCQTARSTPAR